MARPRTQKKKSESLQAQAQAQTAPAKKPPAKKPKRLNAAQKARRDEELVLNRVVRRMTWTGLALLYDLDERTCRKIVAAYREVNLLGLDEIDAKVEVWEALAEYDAQLERYHELRAMASESKNLAVVLGAENGIRVTLQTKMSLLQELGGLPKNLGTMKHEHETRVVVQKVNSVLIRIEKGEVKPEDARREMLKLIGSAVTPN